MQNPTEYAKAPSHDDIASAAYNLWEQAGRPEGRDMEFWVNAEQQLVSGDAPRKRAAGSERSVRAADGTALAARIATTRKPVEQRENRGDVSTLPSGVESVQVREKRQSPGFAR